MNAALALYLVHLERVDFIDAIRNHAHYYICIIMLEDAFINRIVFVLG